MGNVFFSLCNRKMRKLHLSTEAFQYISGFLNPCSLSPDCLKGLIHNYLTLDLLILVVSSLVHTTPLLHPHGELLANFCLG